MYGPKIPLGPEAGTSTYNRSFQEASQAVSCKIIRTQVIHCMMRFLSQTYSTHSAGMAIHKLAWRTTSSHEDALDIVGRDRKSRSWGRQQPVLAHLCPLVCFCFPSDGSPTWCVLRFLTCKARNNTSQALHVHRQRTRLASGIPPL